MDRSQSHYPRPASGRPLSPAEWLRLKGLSPRETEVALLAARGLFVRRIAQVLQVAPGTVKTHLARAREKLECRNVRELASLLLIEGVIRNEELVDPRQSRAEDLGR